MVHGWSKEEIVKSLKKAAVTGAGGAGFPTYMKADSRADWVIANAAECEPLLKSNQEMLCMEAAEVLRGLQIMAMATGARKAAVGIKAKYRSAVAALRKALTVETGSLSVEIHLLSDFYPAGDEHILVYEITGRSIPPAGIPSQAGVVVNNVETLLNVARAIEGCPVLDKMVTVTGAVKVPVTLRVPIGTPVVDLLSLAGGPVVRDYAMIVGGPMMGNLGEPDSVVTSTTGGLIVLPADHPLILGRLTGIGTDLRRAGGMCCHCGYCTELCPRFLLGHDLRPDRTMAGIAYSSGGLLDQGGVWLCSECGLCEVYACPMGLSPRRVNAWIKRELAARGIKHGGGPPRIPHPARKYRQVPSNRLLARLGLSRYDVEAPFQDVRVRPRRVQLIFKERWGPPAVPVVRAGERVARGDMIADVRRGHTGVPVYASVSGLVSRVTAEKAVIDVEEGDELC